MAPKSMMNRMKMTNEKSSLDSTQLFNVLFLCHVAMRYEARLTTNGAIILNQMIQERARVSHEEAFALVSDAIQSGCLVFTNAGGRKTIRVDAERLVPLRDRFIDHVPIMNAMAASERWNFRAPLRKELTDHEKVLFTKVSESGRLRMIPQETVAATVGTDTDVFSVIDKLIRSDSRRQVSDPPIDMKDQLAKALMEQIANVAQVVGHHDFVLFVEKNGNKITPKIKLIDKNEAKLEIDWSQI